MTGLAVWGFSGLTFWASMIGYNGIPDQWKSTSRVRGWDESVLVWLPLSILGGPLWWIIFIAVRWAR